MSTERKGNMENFDPQVAASNSYNDLAGAQKNVSVGPKLKAIKLGEASYTTDATTARQIPKGTQLAIYNNSGSAESVTFGSTSAVASAAAGTVTAAGVVSIALKPNDWTYVSAGKDSWVITSSANALVYVIDDHTWIR